MSEKTKEEVNRELFATQVAHAEQLMQVNVQLVEQLQELQSENKKLRVEIKALEDDNCGLEEMLRNIHEV